MSGQRIILHVFPTFALGGVQLRMVGMMARLPQAFLHLVLSLDGRMDAFARIPAGVQFRQVALPGAVSGPLKLPEMRRILRSEGPDLICSYNWGAMDWALAASFTRIPHVHFESGFGPEEAIAPLRRRDLYRRLALRRVHRLVVPAESLFDLAMARRWVAPARLARIVNGVDAGHFAPPPSRAGRKGVRILSIAPLRREKRLDRLIRHLGEIADAKLDLVGDGGERKSLEALAGSLDLSSRVCFYGQQDDVRPMLADADIFAMTSETEQMPNALLQAMASGLPVVAYRAGDIAAMMPDAQQEFIRAQEDEHGFVRALARLGADADLRVRLGSLNRARVLERHDIGSMAAAYLALFQNAMEEKP